MSIELNVNRVYYIQDVAKATGWSVQRARRTLVKMGIAKKRGGRWVVSITTLALEYPELLPVIEALEQRKSPIAS